MILVKFQLGHPKWGARYTWGRLKATIFDQYLAMQIQGSCRPRSADQLQSTLSACLDEVSDWMRSNRLHLNIEDRNPLVCDYMSAEPTAVCCCSCWREPGAAFDYCLWPGNPYWQRRHYAVSCRARCRDVLLHHDSSSASDVQYPTRVFHSLVVSLVMPRLDYGNATVACLSTSQFRWLQSVLMLNAAIRLILRSPLYKQSSMLHRCYKTFTGCGLRNTSTSSWPCSSTNACMVWRHGTFPTTSSSWSIPTVAASGRRHLCILWSDVAYTAV